jgi:secondary thiamine-phosphate synthase enzyme
VKDLLFFCVASALPASGTPRLTKAMATKRITVTHKLNIRTSRRTEMQNVTGEIEKLVRGSGCAQGVCHLYVPHTTAGVIVNEGYDPDVARDMEVAFDRLIPHKGDYRHAEGNSDSHIKTALVGTSESIWIENGSLALGRWQVIFFAEFDGPRSRELHVKIVPDPEP